MNAIDAWALRRDPSFDFRAWYREHRKVEREREERRPTFPNMQQRGKQWRLAGRPHPELFCPQCRKREPSVLERLRAKPKNERYLHLQPWPFCSEECREAHGPDFYCEHCGGLSQLAYKADHLCCEEANRRSAEFQLSVKAQYQQFYDENAEASEIANRQRRRAAEGSHTRDDLQRLWTAQDKRCANPHCGRELTFRNRHLDHIKPIAKGGTHWPHNLQWLCAPCNLRKSVKDPDAWLTEQARSRAVLARGHSSPSPLSPAAGAALVS